MFNYTTGSGSSEAVLGLREVSKRVRLRRRFVANNVEMQLSSYESVIVAFLSPLN